jgi:hypothetical protein
MSESELWTDFRAMLKDIKNNYPDKVKQDDVPLSSEFGYMALDGSKYWHIKVSDISMAFGDIKVDAPGLGQIISTDSGKQKLLEELNKDK